MGFIGSIHFLPEKLNYWSLLLLSETALWRTRRTKKFNQKCTLYISMKGVRSKASYWEIFQPVEIENFCCILVHYKTLPITNLYIPVYGSSITLKSSPYTGIYRLHIQQFRAFPRADELFSLGNADNMSSKQLVTNAEFTGYENDEQVQNKLENDINDPKTHIPTTLETTDE